MFRIGRVYATIRLVLSFLTNGSAAPTGVHATLGAPLKNIGDCHYENYFATL